ncbi:Protein 60A [Frankliniella fusca]|uniref:Protein 60A n=1 Tax=Frankliniella fusca TaxID=407009 RepID=A0AAE1HJD6_9NEOP|nr:Protein 60A [Frankliniella fusca]
MLRVIPHRLVLLPLLVAGTALASLSGLYIDNGVDQTLMQRSLTRHERQEVEHEILNLLGLPDRPRPRPPQPSRPRLRSGSGPGAAARRRARLHPHLAASAPQFLLDVYQSLEETGSLLHQDDARPGDFNLTGNDQTAIDQSDVIMTFTSHNKHVSGLRHERGKRLWFDVSEVPVGEGIMGAELRLYQRPAPRDAPVPGDGTYTITAYLVVSADHGEKELEFVDAVNTTHSNQGWHVFNMTGPLTSWVAFPRSNLGLYLSVLSPERPGHELRPEEIGLVSAGAEEEKQPFMVAFMKASPANAKVRATRDTGRRRLKKADVSAVEPNLPRNPFDRSLWSARTCQIKNLYVSFKDLDWQDWIIAPDGYAAFYCSGECNFPLNAHMNATNHAIVQTLVHLINPTAVPKPCCVPTKLTPISVLYFLDDSNVVLKKYKNMVVKSCGCH